MAGAALYVLFLPRSGPDLKARSGRSAVDGVTETSSQVECRCLSGPRKFACLSLVLLGSTWQEERTG